MRLIDADVIVVPSDFRVEHFHDRIEDKVAYDLGCAVRELLDEQPTVDAEPVRHGHWDNKIIDARYDVPHTVARCSNCKGKIWVYVEYYVVKYPYCPMCGAKMDEVKE